MIREAIDVRFGEMEAQARRSAALGEFLALMDQAPGSDEDWSSIKEGLHQEFDDHLTKKAGGR